MEEYRKKFRQKKGGKESIRKRRKHNDIWYNGSQHNLLYLDVQHIQYSEKHHADHSVLATLGFTFFFILRLSGVLPNVILLNVVAPSKWCWIF